MDYNKIKTFVQKTLGCGCPEEVFNKIDYQSDFKLNEISLLSRINIGNRLLIYVTKIYNPDLIKKDIPLLISEGKKDRDSSGFNRFRLVIVSDGSNAIKEYVYSIFNTLEKDEKIHLHIISEDDMPEFSN